MFRLLGRDWLCQPSPTEEAVTVARMGHLLAPFAQTDPEVYAAVLADLALRFVAWSVVDPEGLVGAVSGAQIPAGTIINVMAWLSEQYTPPPAPVAARPPVGPRTDLDGLKAVAAAAGLGDIIQDG